MWAHSVLAYEPLAPVGQADWGRCGHVTASDGLALFPEFHLFEALLPKFIFAHRFLKYLVDESILHWYKNAHAADMQKQALVFAVRLRFVGAE